jgi:hypothetical protein
MRNRHLLACRWLACAIALLFACTATNVRAQTAGAGNLEGTVTDSSGGVLPGVAIVVRNMDTNVTRELTTNAQGRYRAIDLQPGPYEVKATLSGFDARPIGNVIVLVGQTPAIDIRMSVAGVTDTVTVTTSPEVLDARRTDVSTVIGETAIENLPVTGRRWETFALLSPGVTNDGNFGLISYRGISGLYNNNMVDGVDNNQAFFSETRGRNRGPYNISESVIKEFQVGVSNMSAEFGRSAGGTINAVTKSGANTFTGEGFYFVRSQVFQAQNPKIVLPDPNAKPDDNRQQFGAGIGGPLRSDRIFFFADYDQQYRNFPLYVNFSNATFLSSCTAPASNCASAINFFNSQNVLSPRTGINQVSFGKLDVVLTHDHVLTLTDNSLRWHSDNGVQTQPTATAAESANGTDIVTTDMFVAGVRSVLGANLLNDAKFQAGRDYNEQIPNGVPPGTSVTGGVNFGMPNSLPRPAYPDEQRYQFLDALTYVRGAHTFKVGTDLNFIREHLQNLFNGGGVYSYSNLTAIAQDCPIGAVGCSPVASGATTGRHYSTFTQAFDLTGLSGALDFNQWQTAFYVQDTWRPSTSLLINLGLRHDYQQLPQPGDVRVGSVVFAGNPAYPLTTRFHQDMNNFGPRVGVTYDLGGEHQTVLRAGYGVFYGLTSDSAIFSALTVNGVSQSSYTFTPTSAGAPAYPSTFASAPSGSGTKPSIDVVSPEFQRPTIQMFDFTVDRQLPRHMTLSASYLYSHGANLPIFRDVNFSPASAQVQYTLDGVPIPGTFPLYRGARPDQNVASIFELFPSVTSTYHALVLQVHREFLNGFLADAHYTLSKATDNGQESTTFFSSFGESYDPFSTTGPDGDAPSSFDRRHRFVGTFYYRPDYLWGIGVSGVVTLESGLPINSQISGSLSAAVGATTTSSTNGTGGAFFAPWLGRNNDRQTGRKTVDLRVSKQFALGPRAKIEALCEIFNVFNWINYTGASSTAFNVASSTYDPAASLATVNLTSNSGFLVPTTIGNSLYGMRDLQLGIKVLW